MANYDKGMCSDRVHQVVIDGKRARKLTPLECERLMGFEDGYTDGFSHSQRYKMLGNSMPVRERESIASRMLFGYCRKLLLNTERNYVDKDEVLGHLVAVLNVQGYDPRPEAATQEQTTQDVAASAPETPASEGAGGA